jgi:hypothetical protein
MLNLLLSIFVAEGILLYVFDRGMKTNRAEDVTEDMVRWAPLYWEKPALFTSRGNVYRRLAVGTIVLMFLTAITIAVIGAP